MSDRDAERLAEIRKRAEAADRAICDVAQDPKKFRMCVPPEWGDTDMLVVGLAREDVPWLLNRIAALERVAAAAREAVAAQRNLSDLSGPVHRIGVKLAALRAAYARGVEDAAKVAEQSSREYMIWRTSGMPLDYRGFDTRTTAERILALAEGKEGKA
jgi:hypothetical protein